MRVLCSTLVIILACTISLLGSNALAFNVVVKKLNEVRWQKETVTYKVDPHGSKDISSKGIDKFGPAVTELDAIKKAFDSWQHVDGSFLDFSHDGDTSSKKTGNDKINSIVWINDDWQSVEFNPPASALAVTITTFKNSGSIVDADIHFNGQHHNWAVINSEEERQGNYIDIQNTATHEIGHMIGIDHSTEDYFESIQVLAKSTMFPASSPGETFRQALNADDVAAITHLYPKNTPESPRLYEIYPTSGDNSDRNFSLEIQGDSLTELSLPKLYNSDYENVVTGKILERATDANGNGFIVASFDLTNLEPGDYDVVVSTSPDTDDRLKQALYVTGESITLGSGSEKLSSGGCGVIGNDKTSTTSYGLALIALLMLAALITQRLRMQHKRCAIKQGKRRVRK